MRRIAMFAGVICTLAAALVGTATAVPAATTAGQASATTPKSVTLLWIDAATGTVTQTWTGSSEQAAAIRAAATPPAATPPAGTGAGTGGGTVQTYLRRISCTDPNPYWVVRNYPPLVCFADAGDANVLIYSVYEVDSGNNVGYFNWSYNGYGHQQWLNRWTSAIFSVRVTVTHIHIN